MKRIVLPFLLLGVGLFAGSCVYNDPATNNTNCSVYVEAQLGQGGEVQVGGLWVYVYDANGLLVGFHRTELGIPLPVDPYRSYGKIRLVAWGNASADGAPQSLPEPTIGSSITDHRLTQHLSGDEVQPPSDLFQGVLEVDFSQEQATENRVIPLFLNRVVSSFVLHVRGMGQAFDGPNGDYSIVVRHPYNAIDFAGNPTGGPSLYRPTAAYDAVRDELISQITVALPTGPKGVVVELYSNGRLVYTATVDRSGNLIALTPNKLQNILIEFGRETIVELVSNAWGEVQIFEGF